MTGRETLEDGGNEYVSTAWHYALNESPQGPVSQEELTALILAGQVRAETLVWSSGSDWIPAISVPMFKDVFSRTRAQVGADDYFEVAELAIGFSGAGRYCVFAANGSIYFIQSAGRLSARLGSAAGIGMFGLLGMWLGSKLDRRRAASGAKNLRTRLDEAGGDVEVLLADTQNSFRIAPAEIGVARITPPANWLMRPAGPETGRLHIEVAGGRKLRLQFQTANDLQAAKTILAPILGSRLTLAK